MPTLGRLDAFGGSWLRSASLLPTPYGPTATIAASLPWGCEFTATVESTYARVRLDLYWPDVTQAVITRYDADGTNSPVRNAEPATNLTMLTLYDHEAPLDAACYYGVTSLDSDGPDWFTDPVTVASNGLSWLKHVYSPALNRAVHLHSMQSRSLPARRGVARPLDRPDPIVISQVRGTDSGTVTIQTDGTWAENNALRALLADGQPLLLQQTSVLGEGNLYISVDAVALGLLDERAGFLWNRELQLPFDVIARPSGTANGPAGVTYADLPTTYPTYEHIAALVATYDGAASASTS